MKVYNDCPEQRTGDRAEAADDGMITSPIEVPNPNTESGLMNR